MDEVERKPVETSSNNAKGEDTGPILEAVTDLIADVVAFTSVIAAIALRLVPKLRGLPQLGNAKEWIKRFDKKG